MAFMQKKQAEIDEAKKRNRYGKNKKQPSLASFKVNESAVHNIINMQGLRNSPKKHHTMTSAVLSRNPNMFVDDNTANEIQYLSNGTPDEQNMQNVF
jgi:hypothetical protein